VIGVDGPQGWRDPTLTRADIPPQFCSSLRRAKSAVHYSARQEILIPSVSAERVKLWSYSDLLALRIVAWLRATKTAPDGQAVPPGCLSKTVPPPPGSS
jgi:hypothetical protein